MDDQSWPPAPRIPPPKAAGISPSRTFTSHQAGDAALGLLGGLIVGGAFFIGVSLAADCVVPPPETYPKLVVVWAIAAGLSAGLGFILWRRWRGLGIWMVVGAELPLLFLLLVASALHGIALR